MKTKKELNYNEFLEYLKKNGITKATTTQRFFDIPKGTILYFGIYTEIISTYNHCTEYLNKKFGYKYNSQWDISWKRIYTGKFIIEELLIEPIIEPINEPINENQLNLSQADVHEYGTLLLAEINNQFKLLLEDTDHIFGLQVDLDKLNKLAVLIVNLQNDKK